MQRVKCVVKGINTFAEECEYKKGDKFTYNSDNGDIKVSEYSITITKETVIKACETVIDELYASKDLFFLYDNSYNGRRFTDKYQEQY